MSTPILCVDDEPKVLEGLESNLMFDFDVTTATSGAAGLDLVKTTPFAVVISDMRMPGMNGAEFLEGVKEASPDTTRMLLTGFSEVDAAIAAINHGAIFRFLTKPCPPEVLVPAVEDAVEQYRLRRAEKELLDGTVRGAVQLLAEVLAVASPSAFARVNELKRIASHVATNLGISTGWDLEVAGSLARLGWIAVPAEVLERHLSDNSLTLDENRLIAESGETAARLLEHIPRLDDIAETIRSAHKPVGIVQANRTARLGAVLSAAMAVDLELTRGASLEQAIERAGLKPEYRKAFAGLHLDQSGDATWVVQNVAAEKLIAGMILDQDVYMQNGNLIVRHGVELSAPMAARLQAFARNIGLQEPIRVHVRVGAAERVE